MDDFPPLVRLAAIAVSIVAPLLLVPGVARLGNLSWPTRRTIAFVITAIAAGLTLFLITWSTSLIGGGGGPAAFVVFALIIGVAGWGTQYLVLDAFLNLMMMTLLLEGKQIPGFLASRVARRQEPPMCKGDSMPQLVEVRSFTGTYALSDLRFPVRPSSLRATLSYDLTFTGLHAYKCEGNGPVLYPPIRGFSSEVHFWICDSGDFPRTAGKACSKCGTRLSIKDHMERGRIEATVILPRVIPFDILYEGPVFTCPNCGTNQISYSEHCEGIDTAVDNALKNAGIKKGWKVRFLG